MIDGLLHQHEWPTILSLSSDNYYVFSPPFLFLFLLNCFGKASTVLYNCGDSVHSFFFSFFFSPRSFIFSWGMLFPVWFWYLFFIHHHKNAYLGCFQYLHISILFLPFFSNIKDFLIFRHMVLIYSFCFMSQTIVSRCFPAGLVHVICKCPLCISKHF